MTNIVLDSVKLTSSVQKIYYILKILFYFLKKTLGLRGQGPKILGSSALLDDILGVPRF